LAKTGRNEPCPCGSGKKYKKCCISKNKPAAIEHVPPSTWDCVSRWLVHHKGKEVTIVNQLPVTVDRETGEKFPEPYIAQMYVDGRTVKALTRPQKIMACRQITNEKYA